MPSGANLQYTYVPPAGPGTAKLAKKRYAHLFCNFIAKIKNKNGAPVDRGRRTTEDILV